LETNQIERFLEDKLGTNFDKFFKDWFYSKGKVDYEIYKVENINKDGKIFVRIYIKNNGNLNMPVQLEVGGERIVNSKEVFPQVIRVIYDGESGYIDVPLEVPFKYAVIDPDSKVPDANRVNNWYPRKIIYTSKRKAPLDAYVVYYDTVPSFSIDLSTGKINYASYNLEIYDPLNFNLSLEGFYGDEIKGFSLTYLYKLPKDDTLSIQLLYIDPDIIAGGLSFTKNIWRKFDIGISGNYWDKAYTLNFSLIYNELYNNKLYLDFGVLRYADYYSKALLSNMDVRLAIDSTGLSFYRIQGGFNKYFLILPQSYLNLDGMVGYINGNPDFEEMLSLSDFKSLTGDYLGKFKLRFSANWNLPLFRDQETKFLNLFIFRNLDFNTYLEFGGVWDNINLISKDKLILGLGFEMKYGFTTIAEIPISLYIGYAFPVWQGTPNPNEIGRFYSYITLGF